MSFDYKSISTALGVALASTCIASPALADVKIGFLATLSGNGAALGQDMIDGFKLALDERDGKLGGQVINLLIEDDQLKPDVGVQGVRHGTRHQMSPRATSASATLVLTAAATPVA